MLSSSQLAEVATESREIARGKQAVSYICWTDIKTSSVLLAPICSRGDNTMYYLNLYPVDSAVHFVDSFRRMAIIRWIALAAVLITWPCPSTGYIFTATERNILRFLNTSEKKN